MCLCCLRAVPALGRGQHYPRALPCPAPRASPRVPPQAVAQGRWVLVEDVNLAPAEVLAALVPLLERRQLAIAARAESVAAAPGFQLIATVTSAPGENPGLALSGCAGLGPRAAARPAAFGWATFGYALLLAAAEPGTPSPAWLPVQAVPLLARTAAARR